MNPYAAYKNQQTESGGMTRIDLLLALYDGLIERMEKAVEEIKKNNAEKAQQLLTRSQLIVTELIGSLDLTQGEVPQNSMVLYEFVLNNLREGGVEKIEGAVAVMRDLREGFQGIRDEAVQLERSGQIPPLGATPTMEIKA